MASSVLMSDPFPASGSGRGQSDVVRRFGRDTNLLGRRGRGRARPLVSTGVVHEPNTLCTLGGALERRPSCAGDGLITAGCGDIDPCTPCIGERLSTPSDEGYARIMLRGSTTLKTAVGSGPRLCGLL